MNKTIQQILQEQEGEYQKADAQEYSLIPEGNDYIFEIYEVKIIVNKKSELPELSWQIKILSEGYKNRRLTQFTKLTGEFIKWTKKNLHVCGQKGLKLTEIPALLESGKLIGLVLNGTIKIREYNGESRNSFYLNSLVKSEDQANLAKEIAEDPEIKESLKDVEKESSTNVKSNRF